MHKIDFLKCQVMTGGTVVGLLSNTTILPKASLTGHFYRSLSNNLIENVGKLTIVLMFNKAL